METGKIFGKCLDQLISDGTEHDFPGTAEPEPERNWQIQKAGIRNGTGTQICRNTGTRNRNGTHTKFYGNPTWLKNFEFLHNIDFCIIINNAKIFTRSSYFISVIFSKYSSAKKYPTIQKRF